MSKRPMAMNMAGARANFTGYGRMTHEFMSSFERMGIQMDDYVPVARDSQGNPLWGQPGETGPIHANGLWMTSPSVVRGWWKGQRVHMLTMWEATVLPPGFRENLHEFDTVFVPSHQNQELFGRFHDNVKVVNLGVNPDEWHYVERPPVGTEFRFLTCGQGQRKGIDIVTKAFMEVFGNFTPTGTDPTPKLIIKDRVVQQSAPRFDRIQQISGTVPAEDEIALYESAHAFVGVSRGEGWGMMPFQAIAQGIPTILSDAHGHADFAHLAAARIDCTRTKAEAFIFGDAGEWWEPDFEQVCEAMWDMYVNYDSYLVGAQQSAEYITTNLKWDDAARRLVDFIGPDSLRLPPLTHREWYEPTIQLFEIVPNRDISYEINGITYSFKRGEKYYEFGDLKRMMFENGHLDPICLRDPHESGLMPHQQVHIDAYRAQHSRCTQCGQKLNTDMTLDFDDDDALGLVP